MSDLCLRVCEYQLALRLSGLGKNSMYTILRFGVRIRAGVFAGVELIHSISIAGSKYM